MNNLELRALMAFNKTDKEGVRPHSVHYIEHNGLDYLYLYFNELTPQEFPVYRITNQNRLKRLKRVTKELANAIFQKLD